MSPSRLPVWRVLAFVVLSLCGSSCGPAPRARFVAPEPLLDHLLDQSACSRAVMGDAKLSVTGPLYSLQGNLLYRAESPDRLRFDLYTPLGVTLSTLTTNGDTFALSDLRSGRFVLGRPHACNMESWSRVRVSPFALVELLRGRPPIIEHDPQRTRVRFVRSAFSRGRYVVRLFGPDGFTERLEIEVHPEDDDKPIQRQRLRLASVNVRFDGKPLYQVELTGYAPSSRHLPTSTPDEEELGILPPVPTGPACEAELPGQLTFKVAAPGFRLHLKNQTVSHNPPFVEKAYEQEAASGLVVEHSNCHERIRSETR